MTPPRPVAATLRRGLAGLAVLSTTLLTAGCEPPPQAVVTQCSGGPLLDVVTRYNCKVSVAKTDRQTSTGIDLKTRRRTALVKAHFTVQQGAVRVVIKGGPDNQVEIMVSPGKPGFVEQSMRLNRGNNGLFLYFHPQGEVIGIDGAVNTEAR